MTGLLRMFGICPHTKTTFPLTPRRGGASPEVFRTPEASETYVVCLDCTREFFYDWKTKTRGKEIPRRASVENAHV